MQLIFMPVKEAKNWQLSFIPKKKKFEFTKHLQGTSVLCFIYLLQQALKALLFTF